MGAIGWIAIAPPRNLLGFSIQAMIAAIGLFAIARMGVWVFPPWWIPYLYGLLFILALEIGLKRHRPKRGMPSNWLG